MPAVKLDIRAGSGQAISFRQMGVFSFFSSKFLDVKAIVKEALTRVTSLLLSGSRHCSGERSTRQCREPYAASFCYC